MALRGLPGPYGYVEPYAAIGQVMSCGDDRVRCQEPRPPLRAVRLSADAHNEIISPRPRRKGEGDDISHAACPGDAACVLGVLHRGWRRSAPLGSVPVEGRACLPLPRGPGRERGGHPLIAVPDLGLISHTAPTRLPAGGQPGGWGRCRAAQCPGWPR